MIKFIAKQIAESMVEKHNKDNLAMGLANGAIKGFNFYSDAMMYIIVYSIVVLFLVVGSTVLVATSTHSILLSVLTFFGITILSIVMTVKLFKSIANAIFKEMMELQKNIRKQKTFN